MARYSYKDEKISNEMQLDICPLTVSQNAISGRWKIVLLWHLYQREVLRFSELQRLLPGVSKAILTKHLRELEADELVQREVYKVVPPKVEYSLTEQGKKFIPVLEAMKVWGSDLLKGKINMDEQL